MRKKIEEWVDDNFPQQDILIADGFEEAFIGVAEQFNTTIAVFDKQKCIDLLMKQDMSFGDANEYFEYNVQGAYVGENTPAFLTRFTNDE